MTSASKNVYIHKLAGTVSKYNNIYHSTIKMTTVDVNSSTYIDFRIESYEKNCKLKVGEHIKISK